MSGETLYAVAQLPPATPQVDGLVFGAAPDTQPLTVQGAFYPNMEILVGGVKVYEGTGRDYTVDVDEDGYAVSVTSKVGGGLDGVGAADVAYLKGFFDADDSSVWFECSRSAETRVTVDAGAGGPATLDLEGRAEPGGTPFPLGSQVVVGAGTAFTRDVQERVQAVRAVLSVVTGPVKVLAQESD